jgi:HK97 family phage portal protein
VRSLGLALLDSFRNAAPVPFVGRGMQGKYGDRNRRGDQAAELSAMGASAALFGIVNRTSTAVAKETWHLHRAKPGGVCEYEHAGETCGAKNVTLVDKHPALSVLNRPNGFYTTQEYFESGQQHIDLTGEGWTIMSRMGRMPFELWVARPDRMIVVTDRRDFLVGYIYVDPDGQEMPIRKEDVLSIRMPDPDNPYRGMGPVQTVLSNIDSGGYSSEWNANFFRNGARPGGIVKLSRKMSDPDFDQLVERFNVNHRGTANANRTAFLEEGDWVDVKPMSIADMQFVETNNLNRDTIMLAFTASKFDVGILDDVNRATAEAADVSFGNRMTIPRLDRWRGMLNSDFLPQFPGYVPGALSFAYSNPVPADREANRTDKTAAVEIYVALVDAGVDPVQAAGYAGLPPLTVGPARRAAAPAVPA